MRIPTFLRNSLPQVIAMTNLLIHIGIHKTGTSALQELLYQNQDKLLSKGVNVISHIDFKAKNDFQYATDFEKSVSDELKAYIATHAKGNAYNVFSAEYLSGNPFELFDNLPVCMRMLDQATKGFDCQVLVTFRRQDDFLQSLYAQFSQTAHTRKHQLEGLTLDGLKERLFRKETSYQYLNWVNFHRVLTDTFGNDRVQVASFQAEPSQDALHKIAQLTSKESVFESLMLPSNNLSMSSEASQINLELGEKLSTRVEKKYLRSLLQLHGSKKLGAPHKFITYEEASDILENYRLDNQSMTSRIGYPIFRGLEKSEGSDKTSKEEILKRLVLQLIKEKHTKGGQGIKGYLKGITSRFK